MWSSGEAAGPAGRAPADPRGRAVSCFAGFPPARRGCGGGGEFQLVGGATFILW